MHGALRYEGTQPRCLIDSAGQGCGVLPNQSLERTSTGKALWPRGAQAYHAPRGPSALPVASAQLKR
jgi:hypothetical protein